MPRGRRAFKRINMLDYFSKIKNLENKLEEMLLRGPLVIGIVKSEIKSLKDEMKELKGEEDEDEDEDDHKSLLKIEYLFDYEEDKLIEFDLNKKLD
jgi:hypothetical protein